jgi:hypothetical protein
MPEGYIMSNEGHISPHCLKSEGSDLKKQLHM